jgi:hypothetical protein
MFFGAYPLHYGSVVCAIGWGGRFRPPRSPWGSASDGGRRNATDIGEARLLAAYLSQVDTQLFFYRRLSSFIRG